MDSPAMDLLTQVETLNKIGIALTSETNLEKLMGLIVQKARELTNADGGSLYLKEKDVLYFYVTQNDTLSDRGNLKGGFKHQYELPLTEESIAGFVALTGEILNIEDAYNLPETVSYRFNFDFDHENNYRTRSILVAPMKAPDGEVVGVLQLINAIDNTGNVVVFPKAVESLVNSLASQAAVAIRNARLINDIKNLFKSLIQYSASAIDARSPHTAGHSRRVAAYSGAVAMAINAAETGYFADVTFTAEQLEELHYSAWLHDIGKIGVPEHVLDKGSKLSDDNLSAIKARFELIKTLETCKLHERLREKGNLEKEDLKKSIEAVRTDLRDKYDLIYRISTSNFLSDKDLNILQNIASCKYTTLEGETRPYLEQEELYALSVIRGNLTKEEYKQIQLHAGHTLHIIENIPFPEYLEKVPFFASSHHEMLDGTGYPNGISGEALPLQSRILAVVDIYDALTASDRPYRRTMPVDKALNILKEEAEKDRLDKEIVKLFIEKEIYNV
jgi:HD-GYP domain-containing protein (c-di-GMP phosphodiesterase class II)